jgi:Tol biopolymer transport system component
VNSRSLIASLSLVAVASCRGGDAGAPAAAPGAAQPAAAAALSGLLTFVSDRDGADAVFVGRPGEEPRRVSPDGAAYYPVGAFGSSGDGLAIEAIDRGEDLHVERLVQLSNGEVARAYEPASARLRNPSVAPDGSWVVFESDRESFRDLYRLELATGAVRRLTHTPNGAFEPVVAPDGRRIAYVSTTDGDPEIYVIDADGANPHRLTAFHLEDTRPAWSPDGRALVFSSDREGRDRLYVIDADGTRLRRLTKRTDEELESSAAWSPDGRSIAHVVVRAGVASEVWVTEVDTGAARRISAPNAHDSDPRWSPDGRHLVYASEQSGKVDLLISELTGGSPRRVSTQGSDWLPRWSAETPSRVASTER